MGYYFMPELEFLKQRFKHFKDKMINLIYGFTGTLKVSENISLSGDISSLMHTNQFENFDGRTRTDSILL
jgi:hypothetical protein